MIVSEIKLFEMLKAKLGKEEAEAFVELLEKKVDRKFDEAKLTLSTKEDLANTKAEIIKWMFIFWMGQVAVIAGLLAYFLNVSR